LVTTIFEVLQRELKLKLILEHNRTKKGYKFKRGVFDSRLLRFTKQK